MLAAGLVIAFGTTIIIKQLQSVQQVGNRIKKTNDNIELIRKSLVNFANINGRLPCPANGATVADTGISAPAVASVNCTNANGIVPWVTLGISQSTTLDGWARKISYRVYDGLAGLTQNNGADMTNCDSSIPFPPATLVAPNVMCVAGHTTSENEYLNPLLRPGFTVTDMVTPTNQNAFVIISHGESGSGAWLAGGGRAPVPVVGNVQEYAHTQVSTTFYKLPFSDPTVASTAVNHYDDFVVYMTIQDLLKQAGRSARNW